MNSARPFVPQAGTPNLRSARFPDDRKRQLKLWWREIDRVLLVMVVVLMAIGSVAVAVASPSSARRLSTASVHLADMHFFWLHLRWQVLGLVVMVATSMAPHEFVRRGFLLLGAAMLFAMCLVPIIGTEVNGARRWLSIGATFQPSEFLKPAFAVACAWFLAWRTRDPHLPVFAISAALLAAIVALLMIQPNLGSAILFVGCWFVIVLLAGLPLQRAGMLVGAGIGAMSLAYLLYDNARIRIDAFLGGGSAYDQVGLASQTLMAGGWTGSGVFLGTRKMRLPEAHTDYIFSVIGEEFGLWVCAAIVVLYLAIVLRVLSRLAEEENLFTLLAAGGLITLFGSQAFINILVNLQLFPSKGMTLPLVSYGGSSTIAICLAIGALLALTRRNPYLERERFDVFSMIGSRAQGERGGR